MPPSLFGPINSGPSLFGYNQSAPSLLPDAASVASDTPSSFLPELTGGIQSGSGLIGGIAKLAQPPQMMQNPGLRPTQISGALPIGLSQPGASKLNLGGAQGGISPVNSNLLQLLQLFSQGR